MNTTRTSRRISVLLGAGLCGVSLLLGTASVGAAAPTAGAVVGDAAAQAPRTLAYFAGSGFDSDVVLTVTALGVVFVDSHRDGFAILQAKSVSGSSFIAKVTYSTNRALTVGSMRTFRFRDASLELVGRYEVSFGLGHGPTAATIRPLVGTWIGHTATVRVTGDGRFVFEGASGWSDDGTPITSTAEGTVITTRSGTAVQIYLTSGSRWARGEVIPVVLRTGVLTAGQPFCSADESTPHPQGSCG